MLARDVRKLCKDKFPIAIHAPTPVGGVKQRGRVLAQGTSLFAVEFEAGKTYHVTLALAGIGPVVIKMESSGTASSDGLF
jgi:hypothetical protein